MDFHAFTKKIRRFLIASLAVLGVLVATFEILSAIAIEGEWISAATPNYRVPTVQPFWVDTNPDFGMWHPKNTEYVHTKSCFSVINRSNSFGARDRERTLNSENRRVLVIGDSFIEGFGLEREQRTTDLLEAKTGLEHLNFATSGHFGPTQYYLLYKNLAKTFRHDAVIIGLLPDNDFTDDDPEHGKVHFASQYRPYFVEADGGYRLEYQNRDKMGASAKQIRREKRLFVTRLLRNFTYSVNAFNYFKALYRYQRSGSRVGTEKTGIYSGFRDFTSPQYKRLEFVLRQLLAETAGRPVILMVIPRSNDLAALPPGVSPFVAKLHAFAKTYPKVSVLDLHQEFRPLGDWQGDYRGCDDHWSAAGAIKAAELIFEHPAYQKFLNAR